MKITRENVLAVYSLLTEATGGTVGIRDEGLLVSALEAPFQTFDGVELFATPLEKAVRLGYDLVTNHPFVDGNKRVGAYMLISLLKRYGFIILFTKEELERIILETASGSIDFEEFNQWVRNHSEHIFKE